MSTNRLGALASTTRAWRPVARAAPLLQSRLFSVTPQAFKSNHVVHFAPSPAFELDEVLEQLRSRYILPAYLPAEQRSLIAKESYKESMRTAPVMMEIDGEVIKFDYMNPTHGSVKNMVKRAVDLINKHNHWAAIVPLLEGVQRATNFRPRNMSLTRTIRLAAQAHAFKELLDCAVRADATGLKLVSSEIVNLILIEMQVAAMKTGWDLGTTTRMLGYAERLFEMLEDKKHQPGGYLLARDPQVIASVLHLAARVAQLEGGKDKDGKVRYYADRLVNTDITGLLNAGEPTVYTPVPEEAKSTVIQKEYLLVKASFPYFAVPVLKGMLLAADLLKKSPDKADWLRSRAKLVEAELEEIIKSDENFSYSLRSITMYERLMGGKDTETARKMRTAHITERKDKLVTSRLTLRNPRTALG